MVRKTAAKARDERLEARISRDLKALFQRAAELKGRTLTDFVIEGRGADKSAASAILLAASPK